MALREHAPIGQAHESRLKKRSRLPPHMRSIRFVFECILFFLLATPFELSMGGGFVYALKASCLVALCAPILLVHRPFLGSAFLGIVILDALFTMLNVFSLADRASFSVFFILVGATLGSIRVQSWMERFHSIVLVYIIINLAGFGYVLSELVLRGNLVDLHGMIFPGGARVEQVGTFGRLSGFHVEPGTYSQWMIMATFLRSLVVGRIVSPLTFLVGGTALLTVSLWAVIGAALLTLAVAIEVVFYANMKQKARMGLIVMLLIPSFPVMISYLPSSMIEDGLAFLQVKSEMAGPSGVSKILAIEELKSAIWGVILLGKPMVPGLCPTCLSPQDAGVWVNALYYFGGLPCLILVMSMVYSLATRWTIAYTPLLMAMLVWKAEFYDPLLWIIVGFILRGPAIPRRAAAPNPAPVPAPAWPPAPAVRRR
jgi:hypothetical protein